MDLMLASTCWLMLMLLVKSILKLFELAPCGPRSLDRSLPSQRANKDGENDDDNDD